HSAPTCRNGRERPAHPRISDTSTGNRAIHDEESHARYARGKRRHEPCGISRARNKEIILEAMDPRLDPLLKSSLLKQNLKSVSRIHRAAPPHMDRRETTVFVRAVSST